MKKTLVVFWLCFLCFSGLIIGQPAQQLAVTFKGSIVTVKSSVPTTETQFTVGNHHVDTLMKFNRVAPLTYQAALPELNRDAGSGIIDSNIVYHNSSGPVPQNLKDGLLITAKLSQNYVLVWHGQIWTDSTAQINFPSYFVAREFPMYLLKNNKYLTKYVRFNKSDSALVVYSWSDNSALAALPEISKAVETALRNVQKIAPGYWHKYLQHFAGANYTLVCFISRQMFGLEHTNSPYVVISYKYPQLAEQITYHEVLHSLLGKSIFPKTYLAPDGKFHTTDMLGINEGLTNFLATRYTPSEIFASWLSGILYRAKLRLFCNNLKENNICDSQFETYYNKGYVYCLYLQAQGLNPDKWLNWLLDHYLINRPFPVPATFDSVLVWLKKYDYKIGKLAAVSYQEDYLKKGFSLLEQNGWRPIPLYNVPAWDTLYVGPYSIKPNGVQLPTDNYPITINGIYPEYVVTDSGKIKLSLEANNRGRKLIETYPDSTFKVMFSNGIVLKIKDKMTFEDGTPYFMYGTINYDKNKSFWKRLCFYLNLK